VSPDECSRLAVGVAAVLDGGDVEGVAVVVEAEPVIADAQAWRSNLRLHSLGSYR
jgi:hypothetical protein